MCLVLIAVSLVPQRPLLLLANRDEFHGRASAAAAPWNEDARIVGGRDLVAGGSWLAARSDGRFVAVTNVRSGLPATAPRSRGALVRDFVLGEVAPARYLDAVHAECGEYGPFNLIVGSGAQVHLLSSAGGTPLALGAGIHVVSNGAPDVHWPKTQRLHARFEDWLRSGASDDGAALDLLRDESQPDDAELPDTGVGLELERVLAPIFVDGGHYGTRASTLLTIDADGGMRLRERRFGEHAQAQGEEAWCAQRGGAFTRCP